MKFILFYIFLLFHCFVFGQIDFEFQPIKISKETKETVYVKYKRIEKLKLFYIKHYNSQGKVEKFEQFLQRTDTPENVTTFSFNSYGHVTCKLEYFYYKNQYILMDSSFYSYKDTNLISIRHYRESQLKDKLTNSFNDSLKVSEYWYYLNDTTQIQIHLTKTFNIFNKPILAVGDPGDTLYYFYNKLLKDSFQYHTHNKDTHEIRLFTYNNNTITETLIGKRFPDASRTTIITFNSSGQKTKELNQSTYSKIGYKNVYKYNKAGLLIRETNKSWSTKYKEHNFKWTYYHSYL